jgi:hypothetical protein
MTCPNILHGRYSISDSAGEKSTVMMRLKWKEVLDRIYKEGNIQGQLIAMENKREVLLLT